MLLNWGFSKTFSSLKKKGGGGTGYGISPINPPALQPPETSYAHPPLTFKY